MLNRQTLSFFLAPLALTALVVSLGHCPARAGEIAEWFEVLAKAEKLSIDGEEASFEADIRFCSDGPAEGVMRFLFRDGDELLFRAVYATILGNGRIVLVIEPTIEPALGELYVA